MGRTKPQKTFMLVLQYSRNVNWPYIFLEHVRQYCRTADRGEEFSVPCLGDSFLQMEGSGKRRTEKPSSNWRIDGCFSKFPINVRFKPFDVIRSEAVCCHFSTVCIAPGSRQYKGREIKALGGFFSLLFFVLLSFYLTVVLLDCSGTVTLYSIQGVSNKSVTKK